MDEPRSEPEPVCKVMLLDEPVRPEFPAQVRCPRCGWVDTFATVAGATTWAMAHDRIHAAESGMADLVAFSRFLGIEPAALAGQVERYKHERDLLADALGKVLVASGLVVDAPMTGPELLAHAATMAADFGRSDGSDE